MILGAVLHLASHKQEQGVQRDPHRSKPELKLQWPSIYGWGKVVARYPDETPAIVEGSAGRGWVILSGVHPEAPASWRLGMAFNTAVSDDTEYARMLILAALNRTTLSHY